MAVAVKAVVVAAAMAVKCSYKCRGYNFLMLIGSGDGSEMQLERQKMNTDVTILECSVKVIKFVVFQSYF